MDIGFDTEVVTTKKTSKHFDFLGILSVILIVGVAAYLIILSKQAFDVNCGDQFGQKASLYKGECVTQCEQAGNVVNQIINSSAYDCFPSCANDLFGKYCWNQYNFRLPSFV